MSEIKVLFVDTTHPVLPKMFEDEGFVCHHYYGNKLDELKGIVSDYQVVIIRSKFKFDKLLIDTAKSLQIIGRVGSGMENIDVDYAKSKNIFCFNSPEGNRDAVADHAIGMLLSLTKNINKANNEVKTGQWYREPNRGFELNSKTIGIIGYGNTGSTFAKRLQGFDCKILAYDKYKSNFGNHNVIESELKDLFQYCDVLSFHIPQNKETKYYLNETFISQFKNPFILINTSRGQIVKTSALVSALKIGKIKAAALDVLEYEAVSFENLYSKKLPADFSYLIDSNNVILTPHIAGWTQESNIKLSEFLAKKIVAQLNIRNIT